MGSLVVMYPLFGWLDVVNEMIPSLMLKPKPVHRDFSYSMKRKVKIRFHFKKIEK